MKKIFLLVFAAMIFNAATGFSQTIGTTSGSSYSTPTNPFAYSYNGQCTWYAFGRAHEKTGKTITSRTHAKEWYIQETVHPKGTSVQANSVVVWKAASWNGQYGHVAYVESVNGSTITIREGNWDGNAQPNKYRETTIYNTSDIIGYIYLGTQTLPDLSISSVSGPTSGNINQSAVNVNVTVIRTGGSLTNGTYAHVKVFLSTDANISTSDYQIGESTSSQFLNSTLNSSGSASGTISCNLPATPATYYIGAIVDPINYHPESNETNNSNAGNTIKIGRLTVVSPNGGQTLIKNTPFQIIWTSENISGDIAIDIMQGSYNHQRYNVPNTGTYTFTPSTAWPNGTDYRIGISAMNGTVWDYSDGYFSITSCTNPSQPGAINGNASVCQGVQQTYSISSVSGASSYNWTLPSGWSGSSTSTSITCTPGNNGGTIAVSAVNSCGTSSQRTLTITVTPSPSQPGSISGNTTVCQGVQQTYSISSVSGALHYNWTLPNGWNGNSIGTSITCTPGVNSGTIAVSAVTSCGTSTNSTLNVIVSNQPSQPGSISGNTTICQGEQQTYSISPVSDASAYIWTLPSGWSGSSTGTSINCTPGNNGGTISVSATNNCGTSSQSSLNVTVSTSPSQPGLISGSSTICQGEQQTYSISPVSGASSYNWTLPSGWSGSSTGTSITCTPGNNGGTISVSATNNCGTSSQSSLNVTVSTSPSQPGLISGSSTICQGEQQTYSISPVSGASAYNWTLPSGWSGSSTGTSINCTPGNNGGTISVSATNNCGTSSQSSQTINVNTTPPTPIISVSGNILHSNALGGNQWYNENGAIPGAINQNYTATTDGDYYVIVTLFGCTSLPSNIININFTGLSMKNNSIPLKIYQNESSNEITIESLTFETEIKVDIYNLTGKKVYTNKFIKQSIINTTDFGTGLYLFRFFDGLESQTLRIIIN